MSAVPEHADRQLRAALDLEGPPLELIKENRYCHIYRSRRHGEPVIVKQYKNSNLEMAQQEVNSLNMYRDFSREHEGFLSTSALVFDAELCAMAIEFVPGDEMGRTLRRAFLKREDRDLSLKMTKRLGQFLRALFEKTQRPGEELDPFHREYFLHASGVLERVPVIGKRRFAGYETSASRLYDELTDSGLVPSFCHGDFVCRNTLFDGANIGLIDFADTMNRSHLLNDLYNMRLALFNLGVSPGYRDDLVAALVEGVGTGLEFPEVAHKFFYEYHRRRWLGLKLSSRRWGQLGEGAFGYFMIVPEYTEATRLRLP